MNFTMSAFLYKKPSKQVSYVTGKSGWATRLFARTSIFSCL